MRSFTPVFTMGFLLAAVPGLAEPTPEEQALKALLQKSPGTAVSILERAASTDPMLRWLAGRVALESGDKSAAKRLLSCSEPACAWGRAEVLAASGDKASAAASALEEMDRALGGEHRERLAGLLVQWARERMDKDPVSATRMLEAVLGLEISDKVRVLAEDTLFRVQGDSPSAVALAAARRRVSASPDDLGARRVVGAALASTTPDRSLMWLDPVVRKAELSQALAAAKVVSRLDVPVPMRKAVLDALGERFPREKEVTRLRLSFATTLAKVDEAAGNAAIESLLEHPDIGPDAMEAWARVASDPAVRRARWLTLAEREGASTRGDRARKEARDALRAVVLAAREGPERAAAARKALEAPDGAGDRDFLFWALPMDSQRVERMWSLAQRFPGNGPWCGELAKSLLAVGARQDDAERFDQVCGGASGPESEVLKARTQDDGAYLALVPSPGTVGVLATGTTAIKVSEHRVDPEALFRATQGHPLDTSMDAFLMEADVSYSLPLDSEKLRPVMVRPRSSAALVAVQVRAGERQATALVVTSPLRIEAVAAGDSLAVAVMSGNDPVSGAEVLIQSGDGTIRTMRTDDSGVLVARKLEGEPRVMARNGNALGFLVAPAAGSAEEPAETWHVVFHDRAVPPEGGRRKIMVVATRPNGGVEGPIRIRSFALNGEELDQTDSRLVAGVATAELWMQGNGRVVVLRGGKEVESAFVPIEPTGGSPGVAISFLPPVPSPGDRLAIQVDDIGEATPDGHAVVLELETPWSQNRISATLKGEPLRAEVDLATAIPGDRVTATVTVDGRRVQAFVPVVRADAPAEPQAPGLAVQGEPLAVSSEPDCWIAASLKGSGDGHAWFAPGAKVVLGSAGEWRLRAWRAGAFSAEVPIRVVEKGGIVDSAGRWVGKQTTLWAQNADSILRAGVTRPGQPIPLPGQASRTSAWLVLGATPKVTIPIRGLPGPEVSVHGILSRGRECDLEIGSGLPEGTTVWAFLHDASDAGEVRKAPTVFEGWHGDPGAVASSWEASTVEGEVIAAALLDEERRVMEQKNLERLDLGAAGARERSVSVGSMSVSGYGAGGGGAGAAVHGIKASVGKPTVRVESRFGFVGEALAVRESGPIGAWRVRIPGYVTGVTVLAFARTPDGRWLSGARRLAVSGPAVTARPETLPESLPESWDGSLESLVPVALSLPVDARVQALAGLVAAGVSEARPPMRIAASLVSGTRPGTAVAAAMKLAFPPEAASALARLEGLPDQRRVERVLAALEAAPAEKQRAAAAVRRLLREPDVEPWVRVRAGLALWASENTAEARQVLAGDDPLAAAGRVILGDALDRKHAPALWAIARAEGAMPIDRALAIQALATVPGKPVRAAALDESPRSLKLEVQPPLACARGRTFDRGTSVSSRENHPLDVGTTDRFPALRIVPIRVTLGPYSLPSRVRCPDGGPLKALTPWLDLEPFWEPRIVTCQVRATVPGPVTATLAWSGPTGRILGAGTADLTVTESRSSQASDPMSPDEQFELGRVLAEAGDAGGIALLKSLLATDWLRPEPVASASAAILEGIRKGRDPAGLIAAFEAHRERSSGSSLDLGTAAAVARAYAGAGLPERAIAATRIVMDVRFREELAVVRKVSEAGLTLTAIQLLRELMMRYPEVPSVIQARYLAPSLLLDMASGDKERHGITRSSLRHTAAAEFARFLLLHPDAVTAPEAASLLLDSLRQLRDPGREQALAGLLADRYRQSPAAWRLALADARARYARGRFDEASRILEKMRDNNEAQQDVLLELGRVYEAQGKREQALKLYEKVADSEARARTEWLNRSELELPPILVHKSWQPDVLEARLRPRTEVKVTAYRIALENLLLRDNGSVEPDAVRVDGLKPESARDVKVGPRGDIPIPALSDGAYLLTLTVGDSTHRTVLVRTDADLVVSDDGGGTLIHLVDGAGRPIPDATVWVFGGNDDTESLRTDIMGSIWLADGASGSSVLARSGSTYAWSGEAFSGGHERSIPGKSGKPGYAPQKQQAPRSNTDALRQQNQIEFDEMLIEGDFKVKASDL